MSIIIDLSQANNLRKPLKFHLNGESLNSRLRLDQNNSSFIVEAPEVKLEITPQAYGAFITGEISFALSQPCGRCSEEKHLEYLEKFCITAKKMVGNSACLDNSMPEEIYFKDERIDITDYLEDTLLLAINDFWSPEIILDEIDMQEKCSGCKLTQQEIFKQYVGSATNDNQKLTEFLKKFQTSN
jgi:uncharacterized metal-binding protein YceD (DUF177 family)